MKKVLIGRVFLQQVWSLTKSYWQSDEKRKAFYLLGTILTLTFAHVYVLVLLNRWNNAFYTALQNYETDRIFSELLNFSWLAAIYIIVAVYAFYLQQILALNWRRWLTDAYLDEWLKGKTYYSMQMFGAATDNPDQRISEDVKLFVEMTLQFSIGLLKAFSTLVSFVVILWQLSGPFEFSVSGHQYSLPGYLVWVALAYSVIGTWLTHKVGRKLVGLNFIQQRFEADFRFSMMRLRENAESVAFYDGEKQEGTVFKKRFRLLLDNFWKIVQKQKQLVWLNSGYSQIAIIFPFVVCIPRYLSKQITLGGLMQIATAFGRVQESLSYFVDMYSALAQWQAVVDRLVGFGLHMREVEKVRPSLALDRMEADFDGVRIVAMEIGLPNGEVLLKDLNFELKPGRNVLVKGTSGSGKSTLLRAIAGIWPYAAGKAELPERERIMFIPQKPYLPLGTLRDALLYPGKRMKDDEELKALMRLCSIESLADSLDVEADWSHVLSIGEQQRLAFVRTMIYEPEWLFLDEATSALDEATEENMYSMLRERLKKTTVVSVGHRSTLNKFHLLEIRLDKHLKQAVLQEIKA
ncbi:MAG: ABC transporter ATP-binding protein/permease [Acidaminococcaceae bacterium]|nr:ABC transporter ATP-binding protein/permease [Acidaminococcaceae bacterium]